MLFVPRLKKKGDREEKLEGRGRGGGSREQKAKREPIKGARGTFQWHGAWAWLLSSSIKQQSMKIEGGVE